MVACDNDEALQVYMKLKNTESSASPELRAKEIERDLKRRKLDIKPEPVAKKARIDDLEASIAEMRGKLDKIIKLLRQLMTLELQKSS